MISVSLRMTSQSNENRSMKRSTKACTSCRQVKLRCDCMQTFPAPCSRCKKNNLECRTDSSFKRTPTRHRLEEVTNQLTAIQKSLGTFAPSSEVSSHPPQFRIIDGVRPFDGSQSGPSQVVSPVDADGRQDDVTETSFYPKRSEGNECLAAAIFLIHASLDRAHVEMLFTYFEHNYYRHCPILDSKKSILALYRSSPFLLWTIAIVSSRWHPDLSHLYHTMVPEYRELLGRTLAGPILELETLQGLILLCFWPLSVERQSDDPSWNYCGLITNSALKLGLHRATSDRDKAQLPTASLLENIRAKTWMACLRLNSINIWYSGLCVPSEVMNISTSLPHPISDIENRFFAQAQVQRQSVKSAMLLSSSKRNDNLALIQILIKDLEEIKWFHREIWDAEAEILLLGVQVNIYAFQIQQLPLQDQDSFTRSEIESSKKILMQQGFNISVRLIHVFSELHSQPNQSEPHSSIEPFSSRTQHLPKHYVTILMFATSFIFLFLVVNSETNAPDNDIANNHIRLTRRMLLSWSSDPMDEPGRAVRMLDVLSKAQNLSQLRLKDTRANSHRSLGLLEDVILTAREIREDPGGKPWSDFHSGPQQMIQSTAMQDFTNTDASDILPDAGMAENLGTSFEGIYEFNWNEAWGFSLHVPDMLGSDVVGLGGGTFLQ